MHLLKNDFSFAHLTKYHLFWLLTANKEKNKINNQTIRSTCKLYFITLHFKPSSTCTTTEHMLKNHTPRNKFSSTLSCDLCGLFTFDATPVSNSRKIQLTFLKSLSNTADLNDIQAYTYFPFLKLQREGFITNNEAGMNEVAYCNIKTFFPVQH